jgi:ectoine hydroxylase-related dioxygenase (phytanoyl-CoA dioxygenase family)
MNIKDGTVAFFDGSMWHSVSPHLSNKPRITFATNLIAEYHDERKGYSHDSI